eukprot:3094140-Pleurochrysis_carterae.AAC.1
MCVTPRGKAVEFFSLRWGASSFRRGSYAIRATSVRGTGRSVHFESRVRGSDDFRRCVAPFESGNDSYV